MRFFCVTIIVLFTAELYCQFPYYKKDEFRIINQLDSISTEGIDTLFQHYVDNYEYLFYQSRQLVNRISYRQEKELLIDYFTDRLDTSDLNFLGKSWDSKIKIQEDRILRLSKIYAEALICQKIFFDSLKVEFYPKFLTYKAQLEAELTSNDIIRIKEYYVECSLQLSYKRDEFLEYETNMSIPVNDIMYNYIERGFDYMDEIPVNYYFKRLGVNQLQDEFVNSIQLGNYLKEYSNFENILFSDFSTPDCQAHTGIPYFLNHQEATSIDTKINALLFAVNNLID